jgi:hypothetical protein
MDADLPYEQTFGDSSIVAIPFGMEINDLPHAMRFGRTPRQYIEIFDDLQRRRSTARAGSRRARRGCCPASRFRR